MGRKLRVLLIALLAMGVAIAASMAPFSPPITAPATAQIAIPDRIWQQVYEQVPSLPKENHYVRTETGQPSPNNTLVGRIIRYHVYVKNRPPNFRLDWKLTLADYLGVNDIMRDEDYPSQKQLQPQPMENDIAAVRQLTRAQRNALVNALTDAFTPESVKQRRQQQPSPSPQPQPSPTPAPTPAPSPTTPIQGPGAADLLRP